LAVTLKRIALYGGTFDPVHDGHLAVARELTALFKFDEVLFIPAHVAPHKRAAAAPASPWHRHAMLALATQGEPGWRVSTVELEAPERPYTVETIARLRTDYGGAGVRLFFVMGADSWAEITTWREWERLLSLSDHVVVTRPGYDVEAGHVTAEARARIVDLRGADAEKAERLSGDESGPKIFFSDAVKLEISSTEVRRAARRGDGRLPVPKPVADYLEKYGLYTEAYDTERN
jgi:nicotinate-nucleotide adenylyltransferase